MRLPFFQLDSFTSTRFRGNPAAVVLLDKEIDYDLKLQIAAENNLSETAFLLRENEDWKISWFTPVVEVPLCGHATLASAAVVMERIDPSPSQVIFHSKSGPLTVSKQDTGYEMDFPSRPSKPSDNTAAIAESIGVQPIETRVDKHNHLAVLDSATAVRKLKPDLQKVAALGRPGLVVTAPGDDGYDIVSRYFAPFKGIPEDPVTGGAHCMLAPYWCERLDKKTIKAYQASARGGEILCTLVGNRVHLRGQCVFVIEGQIEIS